MWITQCMIVENVENVNNVDKYIFLTTTVNIYRHAGESVWIRVTIVNKRGGLDICA